MVSPMQLRDKSSSSGVDPNAPVTNFGEAKGRGFDHVIILPTQPMKAWLKDPCSKLAVQSSARFYVAMTRGRHSVAIVMDWSNDPLPAGFEIYQRRKPHSGSPVEFREHDKHEPRDFDPEQCDLLRPKPVRQHMAQLRSIDDGIHVPPGRLLSLEAVVQGASRERRLSSTSRHSMRHRRPLMGASDRPRSGRVRSGRRHHGMASSVSV